MALPLLPGFTFPADPGKQNFRKSHAFDVIGGEKIFKNAPLIGGGIPEGQGVDEKPRRYRLVETKEGMVPAFLAYEKAILCFFSYFVEDVSASSDEKVRVRHASLLVYLEDETIAVMEPPQDNSALEQGCLVRRQVIIKEEDVAMDWRDFCVGGDIVIYGRTYHTYDANEFTRQWYEAKGVTLAPKEESPNDTYLTHRAAVKQSTVGASFVAPDINSRPLRKFYDHDRKVLRFYAHHDDPIEHEMRLFVVHFFLADDNVEITEVRPPNSGRADTSTFVRKQKLKKSLGLAGPGETFDIFTWEDFAVGKTVTIFGRALYLYDADPFTRQYYHEAFGIELEAPLPPPIVESAAVVHPIPPHSGGLAIGDEDDTMGNVLRLVPIPPKRDFRKYIELRGQSKQVVARLESDPERIFRITYFLNDDTVSVFEPPIRNTGIVGGTFLARRKVPHKSGRKFTVEDMDADVLEIYGWRFVPIRDEV